MNPKDRKIIFYNKLYKLINGNISEYKISPEHYLFIEKDKYSWRFELDFVYFEIDLKYMINSLSTRGFYSTSVSIFNLPLFLKLLKFYYNCRKYGLEKVYEKEYEEFPDELKKEKILIDRARKIKKILRCKK